MAKRKQLRDEDVEMDGSANQGQEDDDGSDEDMETLNVDFEFFDPQPEVDFHGLKTLLRQLFDTDWQLFDLSELADLILSQPTLGSTVKVESNETDPYAFLTVINLHEHRSKNVIQNLTKYLIQKASNEPSLSQLPNLLSSDSDAQVGLILTERFVNMPHQIVPPMYKMLLEEEIPWAVEDKEPYTFSHYLILSKAYTEIESKLDQEENRPKKKGKKGTGIGETFYFHPEDEALHKYAIGHGNFEYTKQGEEGASDSKRAFQEAGIKPQGHLVLIDGSKIQEASKGVKQYLDLDT